MNPGGLLIRPFRKTDQSMAESLINAGLEERWGVIDPDLNPDLFDIASWYEPAVFLVGETDGEIVATGAYMPEADRTQAVRVQRMSVAAHCRRAGYGYRMLAVLEQHALLAGYKMSVLETTETWKDAIRFYQAMGYLVEGYERGDVHFIKSELKAQVPLQN